MILPKFGPGNSVVVSPDQALAKKLSRWLERAGHSVSNAPDGKVLKSTLEARLPDVVFIDLGATDPTGIDLLRIAKGVHPSVPVVAIATNTDTELVVAAMQAGAYDYLPTPVEETKLITTAKNAMSHKQLSTRVVTLEREARGEGYAGMVGRSKVMKLLYRQLDRVASSDITVLIHGESGTGKELIARSIHENSSRASGPFVAINCAAIPENLQESELFGHEKGSFTGASSRRLGKFEQADGGTLFFDEVAELSASLQSKLLRVLQEKTFQRVGGAQDITANVRVVAATHRDLAAGVESGAFREDLYYRMAVLELEVPPLREREGDQALLAHMFLEELAENQGQSEKSFSVDALAALVHYRWPGNVRELQNAVQRASVLADTDVISLADFPRRIAQALEDREAQETFSPDGRYGADPQPEAQSVEAGTGGQATQAVPLPASWSLADLEKEAILQAYHRTGGNVSKIARDLGISRAALYRRLRDYGLR